VKTKKKIQWDVQNTSINYQTLYEQIADSIEKEILDNGIVSQRLPPEVDLVEKYRVSRSVIREALKALKERGLVSMRAGDGSYITMPDAKTISGVMGRIMRFKGIPDVKINEVRTILEAKSVYDAAIYATEADIARLEEIIGQMESCKNDIVERARKDCEFHFVIASLSRNELLAFMVESLLELLGKYIEIRLQTHPEGNESGIQSHRNIVEAIKAHDSILAEKYMRRHLEDSFRQVF
jgi:GntR family transcriptional repressor for pyruvate dehydrogenase complex